MYFIIPLVCLNNIINLFYITYITYITNTSPNVFVPVLLWKYTQALAGAARIEQVVGTYVLSKYLRVKL